MTNRVHTDSSQRRLWKKMEHVDDSAEFSSSFSISIRRGSPSCSGDPSQVIPQKLASAAMPIRNQGPDFSLNSDSEPLGSRIGKYKRWTNESMPPSKSVSSIHPENDATLSATRCCGEARCGEISRLRGWRSTRHSSRSRRMIGDRHRIAPL